MPYTYLKDRCGVRNPNFSQPIYGTLSTNQAPEFFFDGGKKMATRLEFPENIRQIDATKAVQTESQFDINIGAKYGILLVVQSQADKYVLIKALEQKGIFDVNGIPFDEAIWVGTHLEPGMIKEETLIHVSKNRK
jgi:hypothetical protein